MSCFFVTIIFVSEDTFYIRKNALIINIDGGSEQISKTHFYDSLQMTYWRIYIILNNNFIYYYSN